MAKISVVLTGQNDRYDGDFLGRLSTALSINIKLMPDSEFLFVEWNPIPGRLLASEELKKTFGDRIRYIVIDPKYHPIYCKVPGCDFLEFPAKNAGIRRATGEYILCTNSDVVFSPGIVAAMAGIDPQKVYRATRVDVDLNYKDIMFPIPEEFIKDTFSRMTEAAGDFLLMHRTLWDRVTGYCEKYPEQRLHKDALILHLLVDKLSYGWENIGEVAHWRHPSSWAASWRSRGRVGNRKWKYYEIDWIENDPGWGLMNVEEEMKEGILWLK